MERRDVLRSALPAVAAARMLGATGPRVIEAQCRDERRTGSGSWIRTRDGESLFCKDWGSGAPVVFLSAWALPSDMWDYQMVPLSGQGRRCIAFDRRGHGRSSHPGGGYDYDTLADDLAAVLDTLDLRDVTLVGMSMATGEIVRYLTRHGADRVARAVFVATAATPNRSQASDNARGVPAEGFASFRRQVRLRDYPKWLEDNRAPFITPETSPKLQEWIRSLLLGASLNAIVEFSRSMTATDFRAELPAIGVPTLVIHGDNDVSAPIHVTGRPTAQLIPGARLHVYEGAPHGLFLTHVAQLNSDLLAFASS